MVAGGQLYVPGDGTYFEAVCLAELIRTLWGIFKSLALPGIDSVSSKFQPGAVTILTTLIYSLLTFPNLFKH